MKSDDLWMKRLLLNESGELSARKQKALARRLAVDAELRAAQDALRDVRHLTAPAEDELMIRDFTREQILAEARRGAARRAGGYERRGREPFATHWQPAMVYAAISVAVLIVGGLLLLQSGPESYSPVAVESDQQRMVEDERFAEVSGEWNLLFEDELAELERRLGALDEELQEVTWMTEEMQADEWARELLELEERS